MHTVKKYKRTTVFSLVTSVSTLIVTITLDSMWQTQIVGTLEICFRSAC